VSFTEVKRFHRTFALFPFREDDIGTFQVLR
jgi:hypothetical protein